jgi:hypothetical protein
VLRTRATEDAEMRRRGPARSDDEVAVFLHDDAVDFEFAA